MLFFVIRLLIDMLNFCVIFYSVFFDIIVYVWLLFVFVFVVDDDDDVEVVVVVVVVVFVVVVVVELVDGVLKWVKL